MSEYGGRKARAYKRVQKPNWPHQRCGQSSSVRPVPSRENNEAGFLGIDKRNAHQGGHRGSDYLADSNYRIIPKKEEPHHSRSDFWTVHAVTIRDSCHLFRKEERIDNWEDAIEFSTLEASLRYCQVEIDESDRHKTAFTSHHGLYGYTRIPSEPKNAQATIQRAMNIRLTSVLWFIAQAYSDRIFVF